ncbi:suppressor of rps4-rld 1 [Nicotiana attenuata]|uniref:Suppressor of rps4-rld 1 n=1 Tax=Nicotiana attenuata TaxID=49451 RepID=A0A1J6IIA7_NICAT|nr:suppressor of rps4-rld 1 [Nicotiana attenuata]
MTSKVTERIELAKLCSSKEWSKAIRILDSLLAQSCVIQDICNRAFCYSQLELHKHVIKDCDKALQLDPKLLQAYILKGSLHFPLHFKLTAFTGVLRKSLRNSRPLRLDLECRFWIWISSGMASLSGL